MSHHESQARGPDARMVDRMLFFSDAVFAIVLTIMVLELHAPIVPKGIEGPESARLLWEGLTSEETLRTLFAYLISFMLVGLWWSIHMRVTRLLHQFDWPTAIANLFFLLTVTLVPFAASVLGVGPSNAVGWEIYWGVSALASFGMTVLMFIASRDGGRLLGGMTGRERLARLVQSIGPGIGFSIGVWLAAIGEVGLSRMCWLAILPFMLLARVIHKTAKKDVAAEEAP